HQMVALSSLPGRSRSFSGKDTLRPGRREGRLPPALGRRHRFAWQDDAARTGAVGLSRPWGAVPGNAIDAPRGGGGDETRTARPTFVRCRCRRTGTASLGSLPTPPV